MEERYRNHIKAGWQEHMIRLDTGINMAYCECGEKSDETKDVLLIHGVTDGCVSWSQIAPLLAEKGLHCYVVEYRGNGMTDKPDMEGGYTAEIIAEDMLSFMKKLGIERINAVGHSFGSLITQALTSKAPEKIITATMIDTAASCGKNAVLTEVIKNYGNYFKDTESEKNNIPEEFIRDWSATSNEDEDFRTATYLHVRDMPAVSWKNLMNGIIKFDGKAYLENMKCPAMVIWGTEDEIFTGEDQEEVKKYLNSPDVRYVNIEGASHNGFWDSLQMAETYAGYIYDFITDNNGR